MAFTSEKNGKKLLCNVSIWIKLNHPAPIVEYILPPIDGTDLPTYVAQCTSTKRSCFGLLYQSAW